MNGICLFNYLFLFFVELIVVAGKALHTDQQIPKGALKLVPVVAVIEQVEHECLDLDLVEVGEELVDAVDKEAHHELLVVTRAAAATALVQTLKDHLVAAFYHLNKLLQDLTLQFESTHVSIISHHSECVSYDKQIKVLIKDSSNLWFSNNEAIQGLHSFESQFHQLWFLMFHSKENGVDYGLEFLLGQLEKTTGAVFNNVHNKGEEAFSELRVTHIIILDNFESRLAKL